MGRFAQFTRRPALCLQRHEGEEAPASMFIEGAITAEEFGLALKHLLPCKVILSDDGDHRDDRYLDLGAPESVEFVAGKGVRVCCHAVIGWGFAGLEPTVNVDNLTVLIIPSVGDQLGYQDLHLHLHIEAADFSKLPALLDGVVISGINSALEKAPIKWDFKRTLEQDVAFSDTIDPASSLLISCEWGKLAVTANGIAIAMALNLDFARAPKDKKRR